MELAIILLILHLYIWREEDQYLARIHRWSWSSSDILQKWLLNSVSFSNCSAQNQPWPLCTQYSHEYIITDVSFAMGVSNYTHYYSVLQYYSITRELCCTGLSTSGCWNLIAQTCRGFQFATLTVIMVLSHHIRAVLMYLRKLENIFIKEWGSLRSAYSLVGSQ